MLQPERELSIFTDDELPNVLEYRRPHLFSLPGRVRPIHPTLLSSRTIRYRLEHEIVHLTELWRKLLNLVCEPAPRKNYKEYLRHKISAELTEVEHRFALKEVPTHNENNLIERFVTLANKIRGQIDPACIPSTPARQIKFRALPNLLYFEVSTLNFLLTTKTKIPLTIKVHFPPLESNPIEFLRELNLPLQSKQREFIMLNSILFPLSIDFDTRILLPELNHLMFSALKHDWFNISESMNSELLYSQIRQFLYSDQNRIRSSVFDSANQFILQKVNASPRLLASVTKENLGFAKFVLKEWSEISRIISQEYQTQSSNFATKITTPHLS